MLGFLRGLLGNPVVLVSIAVQFCLGVALGYIMAKMARYLLAFIGLLIVGALLNIWSLRAGVEDLLREVGVEALRLKNLVFKVLGAFGVLMVAPISVGFVVGLAIGLLKG